MGFFDNKRNYKEYLFTIGKDAFLDGTFYQKADLFPLLRVMVEIKQFLVTAQYSSGVINKYFFKRGLILFIIVKGKRLHVLTEIRIETCSLQSLLEGTGLFTCYNN